MALCSKCKVVVLRNEVSYQNITSKNVLHMKCSKINVESLDYVKSNGLAFDCEDCTIKLKQNRGNGTP